MRNLIESTLMPLTPRGWVPNPQVTGGDTAPETLYIDVGHWVSVGKPASIEDYYEAMEKVAGQPLNTVAFRGIQEPKSDA